MKKKTTLFILCQLVLYMKKKKQKMQDDINMYVTRDRLNNGSFREKLDPIAKNIFRRQNPLELVFKDISTFDGQNPII